MSVDVVLEETDAGPDFQCEACGEEHATWAQHSEHLKTCEDRDRKVYGTRRRPGPGSVAVHGEDLELDVDEDLHNDDQVDEPRRRSRNRYGRAVACPMLDCEFDGDWAPAYAQHKKGHGAEWTDMHEAELLLRIGIANGDADQELIGPDIAPRDGPVTVAEELDAGPEVHDDVDEDVIEELVDEDPEEPPPVLGISDHGPEPAGVVEVALNDRQLELLDDLDGVYGSTHADKIRFILQTALTHALDGRTSS